jgi:uncharacterized protein involved in response to NO
VMTRASLGHTGRPLTATAPVIAIYACVIAGALCRIIAAFGIGQTPMLHAAATGWILAFGGFAAVFGPLLLTPQRTDQQQQQMRLTPHRKVAPASYPSSFRD